MQAPVAVQGQCGLLGDGDVGARGMIEIAGNRHQNIGGVIGAAQEHHQQTRTRCRRGIKSAGAEKWGGIKRRLDKGPAMHGYLRMNSGEARNSILRSAWFWPFAIASAVAWDKAGII